MESQREGTADGCASRLVEDRTTRPMTTNEGIQRFMHFSSIQLWDQPDQ